MLRKEMYPEEYTVFYICISTRSRGGYQKEKSPGHFVIFHAKSQGEILRPGSQRCRARKCEKL